MLGSGLWMKGPSLGKWRPNKWQSLYIKVIIVETREGHYFLHPLVCLCLYVCACTCVCVYVSVLVLVHSLCVYAVCAIMSAVGAQ